MDCPKKIASVNQGVVILGFNAIKSAVLGVSVIKAFNEANYDYRFLGKEAFWVHAIGTASTCKAIAKRAKFQLVEEAFVSGIIHDIGKLIFDQFFKADYIEVFNQLSGNDKFLYEIEREVIGVDHTKIGWSLIELWNFPENLANAVAYHHLPDEYVDGDATTQTLIDIVHLGNILSKSLDFGYSGDKFISKLDPESWRRLNFSSTDIKPIIKDSINEFFCANEFLSVVREG